MSPAERATLEGCAVQKGANWIDVPSDCGQHPPAREATIDQQKRVEQHVTVRAKSTKAKGRGCGYCRNSDTSSRTSRH
jgi:hypothetical protein